MKKIPAVNSEVVLLKSKITCSIKNNNNMNEDNDNTVVKHFQSPLIMIHLHLLNQSNEIHLKGLKELSK